VRFRINGETSYSSPTIKSVHSISYPLVRSVHVKPVLRVSHNELQEVPAVGVSRAAASISVSSSDSAVVPLPDSKTSTSPSQFGSDELKSCESEHDWSLSIAEVTVFVVDPIYPPQTLFNILSDVDGAFGEDGHSVNVMCMLPFVEVPVIAQVVELYWTVETNGDVSTSVIRMLRKSGLGQHFQRWKLWPE